MLQLLVEASLAVAVGCFQRARERASERESATVLGRVEFSYGQRGWVAEKKRTREYSEAFE
jgi:hypothetical protein